MTTGRIGLLAAAVLAWHAAASAVPTTTTKVLGVVAHYADTTPRPRSPETLRTILRRVGDFFVEGSGGTHGLDAQVRPEPLALPQQRPAGKCRLPDRGRLSAALRDAGISLAGYDALVLVVPPSAQGCPGGVQTAFGHREADGSARTVPLAVAWSLTERYVAHEVLHTRGLGHANALRCRKVSLAADCKVREYGNSWDLLGFDAGSFQMISAPMRAALGWTKVSTHDAGQATYTIAAASRPDGQPTAVAVRLPFAGDAEMRVRQPLTLWIEYRAPFGFDARMSRFENFAAGAMLNLTGAWQRSGRGGPGAAVSCPASAPCLLDMTPETPGFGDAGLAVGRSWTEPFTGTRITVESRTETSLTVSVSVP